MAALSVAASMPAAASTYEQIYEFKPPNLAGLTGTVIVDGAGVLYGTSPGTNADNSGYVYKLTPPAPGKTGWGFGVLYEFPAKGTGPAAPTGSLALDKSGALYGTTGKGGAAGYGTIYKLTPPAAGKTAWTETTLHEFTGGADGKTPYGAGVITDGSGALYGDAEGGEGATAGGVVYKLTPPADGKGNWAETVLHTFHANANHSGGPDGFGPSGNLVMDRSGALYGTTEAGGVTSTCTDRDLEGFGCGTVYKLSPPAAGKTAWTESIIQTFSADPGAPPDCGPGGCRPQGGVVLANGNVFGLLTQGEGDTYAGLAFRLSPPASGKGAWTETILHNFTAGTDGGLASQSVSFNSLIVGKNGVFYGTTEYGGANPEPCAQSFGYGCGTVFALTAPAKGKTVWTETILHRFAGSTADGAHPIYGLAAGPSGALYGTASYGGDPSGTCNDYTAGCGTVFKITP